MSVILLRRFTFLFIALFAIRTTPATALQQLARELHPFLTTGTSVWVLGAMLAAVIISHPGMRRR